jgi:ferritin-like metal-binding protein YciE
MSKSKSNNVITDEKFVLELNSALAMENAGLERLQVRVQETSLPIVKQQLQHHLEETAEHQKRLEQLVIEMGGQPTQEKLVLPLPKFPKDMLKKMNDTLTPEELELKKTEEDLIVENAELGCYHMLIQKAKLGDGKFRAAEDVLSLNMQDEAKMSNWIWSNTSKMILQLQSTI